MKSKTKHIFRLCAGWFFLLLGIIGLVLPILQGVLFIAIGAVLLAPDIPFFQRTLDRIKNRFPKLSEKIERFEKKFKKDSVF